MYQYTSNIKKIHIPRHIHMYPKGANSIVKGFLGEKILGFNDQN